MSIMELTNISTRDDGTMNVVSNAKTELLHNAHAFGIKEGQGMNARPEYARAVLVAASNGVIGSDDARTVYEAYQKGIRQADYTTGLEFHGRLDNAQVQVRTSETKTFINVGAMHIDELFDAIDLFDRAVKLINSNTVKGSTYQNLTNVMRAQIKAGNNDVLDDAAIVALITGNGEVSKAKDEKTQIASLIKSLQTLIRGTKGDDTHAPKKAYPSAEASSALAVLVKRHADIVIAEQRALVQAAT